MLARVSILSDACRRIDPWKVRKNPKSKIAPSASTLDRLSERSRLLQPSLQDGVSEHEPDERRLSMLTAKCYLTFQGSGLYTHVWSNLPTLPSDSALHLSGVSDKVCQGS